MPGSVRRTACAIVALLAGALPPRTTEGKLPEPVHAELSALVDRLEEEQHWVGPEVRGRLDQAIASTRGPTKLAWLLDAAVLEAVGSSGRGRKRYEALRALALELGAPRHRLLAETFIAVESRQRIPNRLRKRAETLTRAKTPLDAGLGHAVLALADYLTGAFGSALFHADETERALRAERGAFAHHLRRVALEVMRVARAYMLDARGLTDAVTRILDHAPSGRIPPVGRMYLYSAAHLCSQVGELELAERAVRLVDEHSPNGLGATAWLFLDILARQGEYAEIVRRGPELVAELPEPFRSRATARLAEALARSGRVREAEARIREVRAAMDAGVSGRIGYRSQLTLAEAALAETRGRLPRAVELLKTYDRVSEEERVRELARDAEQLTKAVTVNLQRTRELLKQQREQAVLTEALVERQRTTMALTAAFALLVVGAALVLARSRTALARARDRADQANRAKSAFLATMSHDLRTPLNGVLGFTELLMESRLEPAQREYVGHVQTSGQLLLQLLNDILDLAKIEAGALELEAIEIDVAEVCREVLEVLAPRAGEKGLRLGFAVSPDLPPRLLGDPVRIRQILFNLVGNAIKFTKAGGVVVDVRPWSTPTDGVGVELAITDSGIGIPPEAMDSLFDPFTQAESSTTRQFGGTGLGLSICKQLCEQMGGGIDVRTRLGKGTTFTCRIRLGVGGAEVARALPFEGSRVLVVDEWEPTRHRTATTLTAAGALVTVAAEPAEAAAKLDETGAPELVLSDDPTTRDVLGLDGAAFLLTTTRPRGGPPPGWAGVVLRPVSAGPVARLLAPEAPAPEVGVDVEPFSGLHVLVAEDNRTNQALMRHLLGRVAGVRFEIVDDGRSAVDAVRSGTFDLVLMDVEMPEMDGIEATRAIRALPGGTALPIVALTANASAADRARILEAGMNAHLAKPIDRRALFALLRSLDGTSGDGELPA